MDVSPKGDPAGFVRVLDESTIAIPDRPGNRRADTFRNVLQRPRVGLLFLIPGRPETLRVSGAAMVVRDAWLRDQMAIAGALTALFMVYRLRRVLPPTSTVIRTLLVAGAAWLAAALWPASELWVVAKLALIALGIVAGCALLGEFSAKEIAWGRAILRRTNN